MKWFTSDTHFGHSKIIEFAKRPFETINEMDTALLDNINSLVKKGDILYHLGDLAWHPESAQRFFQRLNKGVQFVWIKGNHDRRIKQFYQTRETFDLKQVKVAGQRAFLCHYPMVAWPASIYNGWHLHGHIHTGTDANEDLYLYTPGKVLNVNVEFHDFKPWSEEEIEDFMDKRPDNWDILPHKIQRREEDNAKRN